MGCEPTDARFPVHSLYYNYSYYYNDENVLTPLRLNTLCNISILRKSLVSALFSCVNVVFSAWLHIFLCMC